MNSLSSVVLTDTYWLSFTPAECGINLETNDFYEWKKNQFAILCQLPSTLQHSTVTQLHSQLCNSAEKILLLWLIYNGFPCSSLQCPSSSLSACVMMGQESNTRKKPKSLSKWDGQQSENNRTEQYKYKETLTVKDENDDSNSKWKIGLRLFRCFIFFILHCILKFYSILHNTWTI